MANASGEVTVRLAPRDIAMAQVAEAIRILGERLDAAVDHLEPKEKVFLDLLDRASDEFDRNVIQVARKGGPVGG